MYAFSFFILIPHVVSTSPEDQKRLPGMINGKSFFEGSAWLDEEGQVNLGARLD